MLPKITAEAENFGIADSDLFSPYACNDGGFYFGCENGLILRHKSGELKVILTNNFRMSLHVKKIPSLGQLC